jgi:hypothetical protein
MDEGKKESMSAPQTTDGVRTTTPLQVPLKGSMTVFGHTEWKPLKSFYLSSGMYIIDAVYKITRVTHTLGLEGFSTNIEFIYH